MYPGARVEVQNKFVKAENQQFETQCLGRKTVSASAIKIFWDEADTVRCFDEMSEDYTSVKLDLEMKASSSSAI